MGDGIADRKPVTPDGRAAYLARYRAKSAVFGPFKTAGRTPKKSPIPHPHYNWCAAVGSAGAGLVAMCENNFDLSTLLGVIQSTAVTSEMNFLVLLVAEFLMRLSL